jgi:6-pyruvoyltetrahydropterin/6-carboxytetrahydropterin synthase
MFTVSVETHFQASHGLALLDGSTEALHRHDWLVIVDVSSETLNSMGLVIDFHQLKAQLDNVVSEFDNATLTTVEYFRQNNPSAENIAKYIYEKLEPRLPQGPKLERITVVEEPGCSARFSKSSVGH